MSMFMPHTLLPFSYIDPATYPATLHTLLHLPCYPAAYPASLLHMPCCICPAALLPCYILCCPADSQPRYIALSRRYGCAETERRVRELQCIWISHMHADHHGGLYRWACLVLPISSCVGLSSLTRSKPVWEPA
jgi:hypothetical protein